MKLDLMREFCAEPSTNKYLFYTIPHTIFMKPNESTLNYLCTTEPKGNGELIGFNKHEWNIFIIEVIITTGNESVLKIYVNYNFSTPDISIDTIYDTSDLSLKGIGFCTGDCTINGVTNNITWGAAFYKNLRFWDLSTSKNVIQDYHGNL